MANSDETHDVAIIGGALAGAATAMLLLREQPHLRVVILERSTRFGRRVGEATVEVSAHFLMRVLGLTRYLNETQLAKNGMRFWFANDRTRELPDCSELGGKYQVRIPAFQVDRSTLDEEVLRRAVAAGAQLRRPATVRRVELQPGGLQVIHTDAGSLRARWVVDASGAAAVLARQEGWFTPNTAHPTASVWARWRGVKDWDGWELARQFPAWATAQHGIRGTATNHLTGDGWWAWLIPLKGGDVSIGVVYDQRLVQFPTGGALGERLKEFLVRHPVGRELLADAQWVEGDVLARKNLAYSSARLAGDGFVLVGDAAGFLDPLYSPGMDWVSYTVTRAAELIRHGPQLAAAYERDFQMSQRRWFDALYRDKYEYIGEFDLMQRAFRLDLGLYYLGVVSQPYRHGARAHATPTFSTTAAAPVYHLMRAYNRRFAAIARARRRRGALGRHNAGERRLLDGFTFQARDVGKVCRALLGWGWLELTEGWRTWLASPRHAAAAELAPLVPQTREAGR
jgi:flavin-dependent dehydrogenase